MIDPTDVDGYVNLAAAYRAAGDIEAALAVLQQARALSDCDPVVLSAAADTHRAFAALHPESASDHLSEAAHLEAQLPTLDRNLFNQDLAADTLQE